MDDETYRLAMALGCKRSLAALARDVLGFKDVNKRTHSAIINLLEDDCARRKLVVIPRGCLKSSLASVAFPIWLLINNPNLRILLTSELYSNSKNFLREIKLHLESPFLRELFGDFEGPVWSESEITIRQRSEIKKEASVTVSGIGAEKTGQHYDVIIMDDMNSPSNTNTPENAEKVIQFYRYQVSILEPNGIMCIIGTRYAANDLIGHVMSNEEVELIPV